MPSFHEKKELIACMNSTKHGFLICIGSSDAAHIIYEKCHARLENHQLVAKSSMATKAFNTVIEHCIKTLNLS